jgi:Lipase (class 3)
MTIPKLQMTSNDIENAIYRLENVLSEKYGAYPIICNNDSIGSLKIENKEIFISFRGSISRPKEIMSLIFSKTTDLKIDSLRGQVHENIFNKFNNMRVALWNSLTNLLKDHNLDLKDVKMFQLEGYSQGTLFATLTAAYLVNIVGKEKLKIITLAPLGIFDETANKSYNDLLVDRHISFVATEDKLISFNRLKKPGQIIEFSATLCNNFHQRIEQPTWTYLHPWANMLVKPFINKKTWEAHMPDTYATCNKVWEQYIIQNPNFS